MRICSGEEGGDLEKWESTFHEVGAIFIGPDGKDEEEAQALRMAERAPALPAAADAVRETGGPAHGDRPAGQDD